MLKSILEAGLVSCGETVGLRDSKQVSLKQEPPIKLGTAKF